MGYRQCLSLSVVQLKGKHCRKPHCRNGFVDTFEPCLFVHLCVFSRVSNLLTWPFPAWPSAAWPSSAWPSPAWPSPAWPSLAWPYLAWPSPAWPSPGIAFPGMPFLGMAFPGMAFPGMDFPGIAFSGMVFPGMSCLDNACVVVASFLMPFEVGIYWIRTFKCCFRNYSAPLCY